MPISRKQKEQMRDMLKEKMDASQLVVLADFRGLNVATMTKLRRQMRESGSELNVAKNTIAKIAAKELGYDGLDPHLEGPTALAFGFDDPVAPAKVLHKFAKEHKKLKIKAGLLDGQLLDAAQVTDLASLPSKDELLAKLLGGMQAPLYGFAGSLQGLLRNLVYVLDAVREQKAGEAEA